MWVISKEIPEEPGFYWVLVKNEYGTYVYHYIVSIREDGGGCWLRDAVAYSKIEPPPIDNLEIV